jgi:hypothetical protein
LVTQARTISAGKPATPARWHAAAVRARAEGIQVRQLNDSGAWIATSGTRPDRAYTLEVVNGFVHSCSCEAAALGNDPVCKHRAAWYLSAGQLALEEAPNEEPESDAAPC